MKALEVRQMASGMRNLARGMKLQRAPRDLVASVNATAFELGRWATQLEKEERANVSKT